MKRFFALTLAILMLLSMSACSGGTSSSGTGSGTAPQSSDVPTLTIMTYTTNSARNTSGEPDVEQALNDYLLEKGYEFRVALNVVHATDYFQLLDMNLAAGADCDIVNENTVLGNRIPVHVSQNALLSLDEYLDDELAGAKDVIPTDWLEATRINGHVYALPSYNNNTNTLYYMYRKDLIENVNYDPAHVESVNDLTDLFAAIKEAYPDMYCSGGIISASSSAILSSLAPQPWGLLNGFGIGMETGSDQFVNYYASDTYRQACALAKEWADNGYLSPNSSTDTLSGSDYISSGQAFGWLVTNPLPQAREGSHYTAITGQKLDAVDLGLMPVNMTSNNWAISYACKHPDKAAQLLNLLYTDEFVANTIAYGLEGVSYEWNEDHSAIRFVNGITNNTELPYSLSGDLYASFWNRDLHWYLEGFFDDVTYEYFQMQTNEAPLSPLFGFGFDSTSVSTQVSAVSNVVAQYDNALMGGEIDYNEYLDKFIAELEAAGINDIITEAQHQYDSWKQG